MFSHDHDIDVPFHIFSTSWAGIIFPDDCSFSLLRCWHIQLLTPFESSSSDWNGSFRVKNTSQRLWDRRLCCICILEINEHLELQSYPFSSWNWCGESRDAAPSVQWSFFLCECEGFQGCCSFFEFCLSLPRSDSIQLSLHGDLAYRF